MTNTWLLVAALALCAVAVWIVLPPFHVSVLPFAVGAPELSPWFLLLSLSVCAMVFRSSRVVPAAGAALMLAAIAALVFAWPIVRAPLVIRSFDRLMEQGLGAGYTDQIPSETQAALRPHVFSAADFALGIGHSEVLVRRGIEFAKPSGIPLTLDLYRPSSPGPHPVLIQLYGGAWQGGSPEDNGSFASWFAAKGYVVVAIDYRHAPESRWPAQIQDVRTALGWIEAHSSEYEADVRRVAMIGRSAGAQLALVAAYQSGAQLIRAVVSYYGPTDLVEGWREPPQPDPLDVRTILDTYLGGTPDTARGAYESASPTTYVYPSATVRVPPTLLVYGSRDHIVAPRFGRELHVRLQDAGAASVLLEIPWAEHAFDALPNGLSGQIALYYTERFLAWALR
jgi:acetyl esterase/lipase